MPYSPQTWVDGNASYPLSAARMTNIETGLQTAANIADQGHRILTTAQRDALGPVTPGTMIWNSTVNAMQVYIGTGWSTVGGDLTFTNEAARDAAITAPIEGMRAYLTAPTIPAATGSTQVVPTGIETVYNGSNWVCVTEVGSASSTASGLPTSYGQMTSGDTTTNSVTVSTGSTALVSIVMAASPATAAQFWAAVAVSGATGIAASDATSVGAGTPALGMIATASGTLVLTGLTPGTNTFTLSYKGSGAFTCNRRSILVRGVA